MNFGHASRFATREAQRISGELYPGPVLMPRGLLRALDPVIAVFLGPACSASQHFDDALEDTLRGRPDGPLFLSLWSTITGGEIPHELVRSTARLMKTPPPLSPKNRGELLAWLHPRASAMSRFALGLAQRDTPEALAPSERLACGLALTTLLANLPLLLSQGKQPLPVEDLEKAGITHEQLLDGIYTPEVQKFLALECTWARTLLEEGRPTCEQVGDRLARGLRAAILRADCLLKAVERPSKDIFRHAPRVRKRQRIRFAIRAWWPLRPLA